MEHDSNIPRGNNIGMTRDEQIELSVVIQNAITYDGWYEIHMGPINAYVDQLLAAKDARIAALETRQITPEIESAVHALLDARKEASRLPYRTLSDSMHEQRIGEMVIRLFDSKGVNDG